MATIVGAEVGTEPAAVLRFLVRNGLIVLSRRTPKRDPCEDAHARRRCSSCRAEDLQGWLRTIGAHCLYAAKPRLRNVLADHSLSADGNALAVGVAAE
jgi:hypothetical protein